MIFYTKLPLATAFS